MFGGGVSHTGAGLRLPSRLEFERDVPERSIKENAQHRRLCEFRKGHEEKSSFLSFLSRKFLFPEAGTLAFATSCVSSSPCFFFSVFFFFCSNNFVQRIIIFFNSPSTLFSCPVGLCFRPCLDVVSRPCLDVVSRPRLDSVLLS